MERGYHMIVFTKNDRCAVNLINYEHCNQSKPVTGSGIQRSICALPATLRGNMHESQSPRLEPSAISHRRQSVSGLSSARRKYRTAWR